MKKPKWWREYTDKEIEKFIAKQVAENGEYINVLVGGKGEYRIPRHFIALYGIKAREIDDICKQYGFQKIR